ncbi:uncharacterized protein LOC125673821 [Ostrea edulis]|uniref:uncharacterized protein LOC125673821 n=1 Tax=Ostrea edulis TaxID=37623 RepID=UPI0024AEFD20|nr:uncharacterized protein LOC125673821 [Ostrea edulis]
MRQTTIFIITTYVSAIYQDWPVTNANFGCATVRLLTDDNVQNSTNQNLVGVDSQNVDMFRQLLNQETIIRMNLIKNVHALMKDMLTLKENFAVVEQKNSHESFQRNIDIDRKAFELNVSNILADIKIEVRYLSINLLDLNAHTRYMNKTVDSLKVELKEAQIEQLKLSSAVTSLEMFRMNLTNTKCCTDGFLITVYRVIFALCYFRLYTLLTVCPVLHSPRHSSVKTEIRQKTYFINNIGDGYNPSTGVFTAPTEGHCVFFITVVEYSKQYNMVDIILNGSSKVRTIGEDDAGYQTGTNMAVLRLQQGDTVYIRRYSGKGYYTHNTPITTFSDFLL